MFTRDVPERVVDLSLPASERWGEVIQQDLPAMKKLINGSIRDLNNASSLLMSPTLHLAFDALYRLSGGLYTGEIKAIAKAVGISSSLATMLNCAYELSHIPYLPLLRPGCSTAVCALPSGLVHVRNLDWDMKSIGEATRILRYQEGSREFLAVGMVGHVGVWSGMLPGKYSVTINWAAPTQIPGWDWGPSFLLRHVLETCNSYNEAVDALSSSVLSTSVFYTVCGTTKACVIERTRKSCVVRRLSTEPLIQTNHFVSSSNSHHNYMLDAGEENQEILEYSQERYSGLSHTLKKAKTNTEAFKALSNQKVMAGDTYQQMLFCPSTGEMTVRRQT